MPEASKLDSTRARREALVDRLFADSIGALDLLCVYLGDRLGLYRALVDAGAMTSSELAAAADVNERYTREWLEQQTVSGILETQNPDASEGERRYQLPPGHDEVLEDESSLHFMPSLAQGVVGCTRL